MIRKRKLNKSAINNIHRFSSQKMGKTILTETTLEYHACFHFEYSYQILAFESQPIGFEYALVDQPHYYTPDFAAVNRQGIRSFYEAKPEVIAQKISFKDEFIVKQSAANKIGYNLVLITDRQINVSPLLDNLKILHRYAFDGYFVDVSILHQIISQVSMLGSPTIEQLNALVGGDKNLIAEICYLISKGILLTDLHQPLSCCSNIWEAS